MLLWSFFFIKQGASSPVVANTLLFTPVEYPKKALFTETVIENQLLEAVKTRAQSLLSSLAVVPTKEIWEKQFLGQFHRFIKNYEQTNGNLLIDMDEPAIQAFFSFQAKKFTPQPKTTLIITLHITNNCTSCKGLLTPIKNLIQEWLSTRGYTLKLASSSELKVPVFATLPTKLQAAQKIFENITGVIDIALSKGINDDPAEGDTEEKQIAIHFDWQLNDELKTSNQKEIPVNENPSSTIKAFLTDAFIEFSQSTLPKKLSETMHIEGNGIFTALDILNIKAALDPLFPDTDKPTERSISNKKIILGIENQTMTEDLKHRILSTIQNTLHSSLSQWKVY